MPRDPARNRGHPDAATAIQQRHRGSAMPQLTDHLPWGWFLLFAAVDAGLAALLLSRRRRGRRQSLKPREVELTGRVRVAGWSIPRERITALQQPVPEEWPWPVHREQLRRSTGGVGS